MEAGEGTRVPQSRLFGALIRGCGVAPHGFISEAASLVSITPAHFPSPFPVVFFFTVCFKEFSPHASFSCYCSLRVSSVFDHFGYPAPPLGEWKHAKWYNLRLVQDVLEGMQRRVSNGMTPLPGLEVMVPARREAQPSTQRSPPDQGVAAAGSSSHPEIALKSPRTATGKAQFAAATQKRGRMEEVPKASILEDSSLPEAAKRRCQEKPPVTYGPERPCFEDTFEESDDSNESFDGPFSGSSSTVAASRHHTTPQWTLHQLHSDTLSVADKRWRQLSHWPMFTN